MAEPSITLMYHVEKFLPAECPKCRSHFQQEGTDYARFLGDIIDGRKAIRKTKGYFIIVCAHCENLTACWPLEIFQTGDKTKAEAFIKEKGFVNLTEVHATGNMAQETHAIIGQAPDLRVE